VFVVADGHELDEIENIVEHHGDCLLVDNHGRASVAASADDSPERSA
jgi:hypothetical protein